MTKRKRPGEGDKPPPCEEPAAPAPGEGAKQPPTPGYFIRPPTVVLPDSAIVPAPAEPEPPTPPRGGRRRKDG